MRRMSFSRASFILKREKGKERRKREEREKKERKKREKREKKENSWIEFHFSLKILFLYKKNIFL